MSENRTSEILVSFGVGLLVGAAGALLLAPAPGTETRRRLGQLGHDALEKARGGVEGAREFAGDHARRLERAVHEGKEAYLRESQARKG